jgi:hypothetical protein
VDGVTRRKRGRGSALLAVLVALLTALGAGATSDHVPQSSHPATAAVVGLIQVSHATSEEPAQFRPVRHQAGHQVPASTMPASPADIQARLRSGRPAIARPTPDVVLSPPRTRGPPVTS